MAEKIRYEVDVDASDAKRGLQEFSRAAKKAGKDAESALDDTASAGDKARAAIKQMADTMDTELRAAAKAAEALGDALGPELAGRTDLDQMVADLGRMGVSFDEVRADADLFADTLRQVDGVRLQQVNDGLNTTHNRLGQVRDTGDQSRSVLANLAGNAAQDLGQLGGVVGSLGVGIGQLAEYAVDGNIKLSNLAKVAGPMAGLSAALLVVNTVMGRIAAQKALDAERAQAYADAIEDAGVGAEAVVDRLREADDIMARRPADAVGFDEWLFGRDPIDVIANLDAIGTTAGELGETFERLRRDNIGEFDEFLATPDIQRMSLALEDLNIDGQDNAAIIHLLFDEYTAYSNEVDEATKNSRFFASTVDGLNTALAGLKLDDDPFSQFQTTWNSVLDDLADGRIDLAKTAVQVDYLARHLGMSAEDVTALGWDKIAGQAEELATAIGAVNEADDEADIALRDRILGLQDAAIAFDAAASRAESFATALDEVNDASELNLSQRIITASDAVDTFGEALDTARQAGVDFSDTDFIPETWGEVRDMDDDLKPLVAAFATARTSIQDELMRAFEFGGMPAFNTALGNIRAAYVNELAAAGIDGGQELVDALEALGLDQATIDILLRVTGEQEAQRKIDTILAAVSDLPPSVVLNVLAIADKDGTQAALDYLISYLAGQGVTVPAELTVDTDDAEDDIGDVVDKDYPVNLGLQAQTADAEADIGAVTDKVRTAQVLTNLVQQVIQGLKLNAFLDFVARNRTANVNVQANTHPADLALAIWRTVQANTPVRVPVVVGSISGGGGSSGGGATPAPGMALATTAAPTAAALTPSAVTMSAAPAATVVNTTVTINAGVLGNHFDVERSVWRALRRHQRVNGRR